MNGKQENLNYNPMTPQEQFIETEKEYKDWLFEFSRIVANNPPK